MNDVFGLNPIDLGVIVLYLAGVTFIGLRSSKKVKDTGDFFMGGRKFGKLLMVAKAFAVGTRADQAVAVTGASYSRGLAGVWIQWLYIFSTPFFWIVSPIYRRLRYVTTGDFFERRFGKAAGAIYTAMAILYFSVTIATVFRAIGTTIEALTQGQLSGNVAILITTAVFVSYSVSGGLVAAVSTKLLQSAMLLILSLILIPFAMAKLGGFGSLHDVLAPAMFSLFANKEITFFFVSMVTVNALVGVVALPHHMAIGGAGKSEMGCRTGWTYGNITKRFVTLAWAFVGLFGIALYPGLADSAREQAFGMMVLELLPVGLVGLMVAAMVASIMAVCDAYMVDGSALFTRNIYKAYVSKDKGEGHYLTVARWSSILVVALGILIAFKLANVIAGLKILWTIMAFMGIPFWMAICWRKSNRYGFWVSVVVATGLYLYTQHIGWAYPARVALYVPAGFVSFIIASLLTKPEPEGNLNAFYMLLHTPVGEEYKLHEAGVEIIHGGAQVDVATIERNEESLEERGHSLLLVDLLSLHKKFSFKRYRVDILGFAAAWGLVIGIILMAILLAKIGI